MTESVADVGRQVTQHTQHVSATAEAQQASRVKTVADLAESLSATQQKLTPRVVRELVQRKLYSELVDFQVPIHLAFEVTPQMRPNWEPEETGFIAATASINATSDGRLELFLRHDNHSDDHMLRLTPEVLSKLQFESTMAPGALEASVVRLLKNADTVMSRLDEQLGGAT